jgi:hypothetical protein
VFYNGPELVIDQVYSKFFIARQSRSRKFVVTHSEKQKTVNANDETAYLMAA